MTYELVGGFGIAAAGGDASFLAGSGVDAPLVLAQVVDQLVDQLLGVGIRWHPLQDTDHRGGLVRG